MSLFCPPSRAPRDGPRAWTYLGKDADRRERLRRRLGPPRPIGPALRAASERLRRPFLDWVARLGIEQRDPAAWWAGLLPWKAWSASDLFLLACYRELAHELARAKNLCVIVEDPWLLRQLQDDFGLPPGAGSARIGLRRLRALSLGLLRRARWTARMLRSALLQAASWKGPFAPPETDAVLYSHLLPRCFEKADWKEPYLPGLGEELSAAGLRTLRLSYPDSTGFERKLSRLGGSVWPAILCARPSDLALCALALPPLAPELPFQGRGMSWLLRREWWEDFSKAGRAAYLFFWRCARRFLLQTRPRVLWMPWEAQPQERMLVLAAREARSRVLASQHSTVPRMQLPFFPGRGESAWAPLPDALFVSGEHPGGLLSREGFPAERLRRGGSRRFAWLARKPPSPSRGTGVLILLPVDRQAARHFLLALARHYPEGGQGFEFIVKPHPSEPLRERDLPFPARLARESLDSLLPQAACAVFCQSTSGLEAWLSGASALRYRPDPLLDVDPYDMILESDWPTASDEDLRTKIEEARSRRPPPAPALLELAERLFSPVDKGPWLEASLGPDASEKLGEPRTP